MKIKLHDVEYDLSQAVSKARLNDLMELKVKTRIDGHPGVDPKSIRAALLRMGTSLKEAKAALAEPDDDALAEIIQDVFLELLGDDDFLRNFVGLIFLARRYAGENTTVKEAGEFAFFDVEWVVDEDVTDEETGADAGPFTGAAAETPPPTS